MTSVFSKKIIEQAREHAREAYPEESCGLVARGVYVRCDNVAADPATHEPDNKDCGCRLCAFIIASDCLSKHLYTLEGVIHSHPDGRPWPSKADMISQIQTDVPWMIMPLDAELDLPPVIWGGDIEPVIGREFVHGVTDCMSLIRDVFRLGKDALAEQHIEDWPYDPIDFKDCAREDEWWLHGESLYEENWKKWGFEKIAESEARSGDVFIAKIRSNVPNHGGVMVGDDTILHHLPNRLSRREPAGIWARNAYQWFRYVGDSSDA